MKKKTLLLPLLAFLPACGSGSSGSSANSLSLAASVREQSLQPFCMQSSVGLVELSSASILLSGGAEIGGDAILMGTGSSAFSGQGRIDGTLYMTTSSHAVFSGGASAGGVVNQDLSAQAASIQNVINNLANLAPTQTFAAIGKGGKVIVGNGGVNVIAITGGILLSGSDAVVLQGGASDLFVLNVQGNISMSGQTGIKVQGGVLAKNVLINNLGAGGDVNLSGSGGVVGTVFGSQRGVNISGGGTIVGSVIVGRGVHISGQGKVIQPQAFCSIEGTVTVPQPTTTTTSTTTTSTTVPSIPDETTTTTIPPTTTTVPSIPDGGDPSNPNPDWPPECYDNPMLCG